MSIMCHGWKIEIVLQSQSSLSFSAYTNQKHITTETNSALYLKLTSSSDFLELYKPAPPM